LSHSWQLWGRHAKTIEKSMPKMNNVGSQKGAKRDQKSNPKRSKIEDKHRCEERTGLRKYRGRLGPIFRHVEGQLGVQKSLHTFCVKRFGEQSWFRRMNPWNRSWTDLKPMLGQLGTQHGSNMAPQNDQQTNKACLKHNGKKNETESKMGLKTLSLKSFPGVSGPKCHATLSRPPLRFELLSVIH